MIEAETETAEIPIKKTAQVVLPMGSTSLIDLLPQAHQSFNIHSLKAWHDLSPFKNRSVAAFAEPQSGLHYHYPGERLAKILQQLSAP
jgi:hypothetical protein